MRHTHTSVFLEGVFLEIDSVETCFVDRKFRVLWLLRMHCLLRFACTKEGLDGVYIGVARLEMYFNFDSVDIKHIPFSLLCYLEYTSSAGQ